MARAATAAPAISPVDASTPLGTSQATTHAPLPLAPASLIAAIAPAAGSRGSPEKPVPRIASTIPAAPSSAAAANGAAGDPGSRSAFTLASPRSSSTSPSSSTSTSRPRSRSRRAATNPSPPLLPLPHTATIRPAGDELADQVGQTGAGALHQLDARDSALAYRPLVEGPLLGGIEQRIKPVRKARHRHGSLVDRPRLAALARLTDEAH